MATQLQIRRGTSSQVAAFTGAEGEIVVNTTNDSVHVNDGSTQGGFELARVDGSNWAITNAISTTNNISFGDNDKAIFGAGSDLEILSNGTDGLIRNGNATGEIRMESDDRIIISDRGFNEVFAVFNDDDDVKLYHNGSQRLATTSSGLNCTGTVTADGLTVDTTTLVVDATNNRVGIGTSSPTDTLTISSNTNQIGLDTGNQATYGTLDVGHFTNGAFIGTQAGSNAGSNMLRFGTSGTEAMRIDANGNVGIGGNGTGTGLGVYLSKGSGANFFEASDGTKTMITGSDSTQDFVKIGSLSAHPVGFVVGNGEKMRIDASGNLLVGTTNVNPAANNVTGHALKAGGLAEHANSGAVVMRLNRTDSDGDILQFYKGTGTVGVVGAKDGDVTVGTSDTGFRFIDGSDAITPHNTSTNAGRDNAISLGSAGARYKDLYLSGGVYLGGTGSANKLDDYEEGTWSPLLQRFDGNIPATFYVAPGSARYTKIGNTVHLMAFINGISNGSSNGSSYWVIYGIPFAGQVIDYSGTALAYNSSPANTAYVGDASGNAILTSNTAPLTGSISGAFMLNLTYKVT